MRNYTVNMVKSVFNSKAKPSKRSFVNWLQTVRVAPNEISYVDGRAWKDIYYAGKGGLQLQKEMPGFPSNYQFGIFYNPDNHRHAEIRKLLGPSLSERGVAEREGAIQKYSSLLVEQLIKHGTSSPVDIVKWFKYTVMDLLGDLTNGESFQCL